MSLHPLHPKTINIDDLHDILLLLMQQLCTEWPEFYLPRGVLETLIPWAREILAIPGTSAATIEEELIIHPIPYYHANVLSICCYYFLAYIASSPKQC